MFIAINILNDFHSKSFDFFVVFAISKIRLNDWFSFLIST